MGKHDIGRIFDALGDPTRRAIVDRLSAAPASVSHLAVPLDITVTAVSQHLAVLEKCGLVRTQKVGRVRTCSIEGAGFDALSQWISDHRKQWEQRLDKLGEILDEED